MWLSQRRAEARRAETTAETGPVTLGGDPAGVYLSGERRGLPVFSPGGYQWRPAAGQEVLVLKAGADQESPCVVGVRQAGTPEPGETYLFSQGEASTARLRPDGSLELTGQVSVNGERLEALVRRVVAEMLSSSGEEEDS